MVVPYSLYSSKHMLGTALSSIWRLCSMNSAIEIAHENMFKFDIQLNKLWSNYEAVPSMFFWHAKLKPVLIG